MFHNSGFHSFEQYVANHLEQLDEWTKGRVVPDDNLRQYVRNAFSQKELNVNNVVGRFSEVKESPVQLVNLIREREALFEQRKTACDTVKSLPSSDSVAMHQFSLSLSP